MKSDFFYEKRILTELVRFSLRKLTCFVFLLFSDIRIPLDFTVLKQNVVCPLTLELLLIAVLLYKTFLKAKFYKYCFMSFKKKRVFTEPMNNQEKYVYRQVFLMIYLKSQHNCQAISIA